MIPSTLFGFRLIVSYSCMYCSINYCIIQVPSTIPELYAELRAAIADSEQRIVNFCKDEFAKIRNEMKVRCIKLLKNILLFIYNTVVVNNTTNLLMLNC